MKIDSRQVHVTGPNGLDLDLTIYTVHSSYYNTLIQWAIENRVGIHTYPIPKHTTTVDFTISSGEDLFALRWL